MKFSIRTKAALLAVCMAPAMIFPGCAPKAEAYLASASESSSETQTATEPDNTTGSESGSDTVPEETTTE
ncbi:MAG: hypothetical protein J6W36_09385, partial [Clostridiales bacterium]|nr:hypothetical protein [Clostridiales bacterium]